LVESIVRVVFLQLISVVVIVMAMAMAMRLSSSVKLSGGIGVVDRQHLAGRSALFCLCYQRLGAIR
jgi:hypothetical protein